MKETIIIIPAYNERESIEYTIDNIINTYPQYDFIVINDGSTDDTGAILERRGYPHLNLPINLGIGGGVQTGYKYALRMGYHYAVQIDADGQHDPSYIAEAIELLRTGDFDGVIGSRFIKRQGFQSSRMRRVGIMWLSLLIYCVCGTHINDVTSGYRIVNRKLIELYANRYARDYPEPEALVSGMRSGARFAEIPMSMQERYGGKSSISGLKAIYYMIKVSLAIIITRIS